VEDAEDGEGAAGSAGSAAGGGSEGRMDMISPDSEDFTGFVFKLQANLDPRHR
jgi:peptide subunit release factor RF-3